jgi:hypothetical protein
MNFNGILIGSEDPKRLTDYYRKVLGEPGYDDGGYTTWQIGSGSISVGPHSEVHGKNAAPGRIIWNIESDDVKLGVLRASGDRTGRPPHHHPCPDLAVEARRTSFDDPAQQVGR